MFLQRKKRETPPVPPKATGELEARIIALACGEVPKGYARCTKNSLPRQLVSSALDRLYRRLNNADNLLSLETWKDIFE